MTQHFKTIREANRFMNALSRLTDSQISIMRDDGLWRVQANDINGASGDALRELLEEKGNRADRITLDMVIARREGLDRTL